MSESLTDALTDGDPASDVAAGELLTDGELLSVTGAVVGCGLDDELRHSDDVTDRDDSRETLADADADGDATPEDAAGELDTDGEPLNDAC